MMDIGRVCVKIAGRDAGQKCVIVDTVDQNYVLIDGQTRRRKCNIKHVEPTTQKLDIDKGAGREEVKKAFKTLGIELVDAVKKEKKIKTEEEPKAEKK